MTSRLSKPGAALSLAAALATGALGLWKGAFVAGGPDSYGYVSEADLIAHGSLRVDQQFVRTMPWPFADWSFAPPGYRPATIRGFIVPTYPPGVPILMALFQRLAGARAVFYVVPLLGALCVWMTSELGASIHGRLTGTMAALLVAVSPSFMVELMAPASDVAATCWWTSTLALAVRDTSTAALGAGLTASLAVLTRPSLAPLAALVGLFYVWRLVRGGTTTQLAWFVAAALPGCLAVAAINGYLYGSPLRSGYEPVDALYSVANWSANLDRYPRWLIETQTPFICLAFAAPLFARGDTRRQERAGAGLVPAHVALLLSFAVGVFLSYLFYRPFGRGEWGYLRFLLPAYPALLILAVAVTLEGARRVIAGERAATAAYVMVCGALGGWLARESVQRGALAAGALERRYRDVGRYIAAMLPANGVFIASLHAGSIRYYSGRLTINYQRLEPGWLDTAVKELTARGYHPFIAVDEYEEAQFRERFGASNRIGLLDWPPVAERIEPVHVRIYDPADREPFRRNDDIATRVIERARRW